MSGGQHRNDGVNGPSRSGEREGEGRRNRERNRLSGVALTHGCAQKKKKLRQNVLDGAGFVRDVRNSYFSEWLRILVMLKCLLKNIRIV